MFSINQAYLIMDRKMTLCATSYGLKFQVQGSGFQNLDFKTQKKI